MNKHLRLVPKISVPNLMRDYCKTLHWKGVYNLFYLLSTLRAASGAGCNGKPPSFFGTSELSRLLAIVSDV